MLTLLEAQSKKAKDSDEKAKKLQSQLDAKALPAQDNDKLLKQVSYMLTLLEKNSAKKEVLKTELSNDAEKVQKLEKQLTYMLTLLEKKHQDMKPEPVA